MTARKNSIADFFDTTGKIIGLIVIIISTSAGAGVAYHKISENATSIDEVRTDFQNQMKSLKDEQTRQFQQYDKKFQDERDKLLDLERKFENHLIDDAELRGQLKKILETK